MSVMPEVSAGVMVVRRCGDGIELLLAHPGGPFFANKDDGWWTIPKGLVQPGEDPVAAARRELREELGLEVAEDGLVALGSVRQKSGKVVHAWACWGDCDPAAIASNTFEIEWPPRSGRRRSFPEIDRAGFFAPDQARKKLLAAQVPFVDRVVAAFAG
jgi:predicted NUDIX family NTP pyrophosphohydrolase